MYTEKTTLLHVEPTTRCNASCPGCPRNNNGFGLADGFVLQDLSPDTIVAEASKLPNLRAIHLCGNLGDPIAYKYLNELIDKAVAQTRFIHQFLKVDRCWDINIATNGSLRSVKWWQELGKKCSVDLTNSHTVVFGIDGLADTSPMYRQGTNFNKVIDNAKAFIDEGGVAEWQYLVFKHNQHHIEEAKQLAKDIGFKKFFVLQPHITSAYHWKTGERYYLEPADFIESKDKANNTYVKHEDCMHINVNGNGDYSLFLTVGGKLTPCCHFDILGTSKEEYDIETLDIKNEFDNNEYRFTCRRKCGSVK